MLLFQKIYQVIPSPLNLTITFNNESLKIFLINQSANVNRWDKDGKTFS